MRPWIWTRERCVECVKKCESVPELKKRFPSAYHSLRNHGWYHEVLDSIFPDRIKAKTPWTFETCKVEALKYNHRIDFMKGSGGAYTRACKEGWLDDVCSHMKPKGGNKIKRCVYVYEFSDNHAYVGLTYNIERRVSDRARRSRDAVTRHKNKTRLKPQLKILTDYIDVKKAVELEGYYCDEYSNNGWIMLNIAKTGAIGGGRKWTKELCLSEAKKYKRRMDFKKRSSGAYYAACTYGWLDEICSHMVFHQKPNGYWTKERCLEIFEKYKTSKLVRQHELGAYCRASREGWLGELNKYLIA